MNKNKRIVLMYDLPLKEIYHTIHGSTKKQYKIGDTLPITLKRRRSGEKRLRREKCLAMVQNSDKDNYFIIIPDDYVKSEEIKK